MNKINKIYYFLAMAALIVVSCFVMTSCGGGGLEKAIKNALIKGDTTQVTYDSICSIIKADPKKYSQFLDKNGEINVDALGKYINEIGSKLRPPMSWNIKVFSLKDLSLTVYFERSGSMTPYDTPDGGGQLKMAVNNLINFFPSKDVSINIVNDNIYPYNGTVDSFLQDRDIYKSTSGTGNSSYTDFKLIFEKIFKAQKTGNVSVLVTDMIYSPQNTADVSVEKILNEENSVATSIFKTYKGKSIIVNQFMGDYNGLYYPYNGTPFTYKGKRPFYVIIIGDAATLDVMACNDKYAKFLHPDGVKNSYRFNQAQTNINFKIIPDWKDNVGRFRVSHDEQGALSDCKGDICFTIAANFKPLNLDNNFLSNTANYSVNSQCGFKISVREIKSSDINNNNREYLKGMTHLITVKGTFNKNKDQLTITLSNQFPNWINAASSTSDANPSDANFANTTFGLERFLRGIYDAFSSGNDNYGSIVIKLSD